MIVIKFDGVPLEDIKTDLQVQYLGDKLGEIMASNDEFKAALERQKADREKISAELTDLQKISAELTDLQKISAELTNLRDNGRPEDADKIKELEGQLTEKDMLLDQAKAEFDADNSLADSLPSRAISDETAPANPEQPSTPEQPSPATETPSETTEDPAPAPVTPETPVVSETPSEAPVAVPTESVDNADVPASPAEPVVVNEPTPDADSTPATPDSTPTVPAEDAIQAEMVQGSSGPLA